MSLLVSKKKHTTIQNLIVSIVNPLKSLGVNSLTELLQGYNNSHVISPTETNTEKAGRQNMNKHLNACLLYSAAHPLGIYHLK